MNLEVKINEGIKSATRSGEKLRLETLRSIRAAIIEFNKSGSGRSMNEADEIKILNTAAKRRRDAIEMYKISERTDLVDKEQQELEIIKEFLPKQLGEEEIIEIVKKKIAETGATGMQDLGKVMGAAMKEFAGKADGATIQRIVKDLLGGSIV